MGFKESKHIKSKEYKPHDVYYKEMEEGINDRFISSVMREDDYGETKAMIEFELFLETKAHYLKETI